MNQLQNSFIRKEKLCNSSQRADFRQSGLVSDKFQCNNKISFKKAEGPSQQTIDYINQVRKDLEAKEEKLEKLSQLDLSKIKDIAKGIDIFEGWNSYDLAFLSRKFEAILLQRGCSHQCSHCGANSEIKITNMHWDNFKAIAEGMGELKNRLGFNIFKLNSKDVVYPFHDSDPMLYRSVSEISDVNGNKTTVHKDIYDAAKLFYGKTGTPFFLTTAGWDPNNKISQNAALKILQDPSVIKRIDFSISPFHHHLELSREYERQAKASTNQLEQKELLKKSEVYKNKYIDMVASNIFTLWPLTKDNKLVLIDLFDRNNQKEYSMMSTFEIIKSIFQKIKQKELIYSITLDPTFNNSSYYPLVSDKEVKYIGRANNFLKSISNSQFNAENFYSQALNNPETILDRPIEINTDGSILINALENPDWQGDVRSYLFQFKDKKLNLPKPQVIKTTKELPLISWPSEDYTKRLN